jgi:hypothetical protein
MTGKEDFTEEEWATLVRSPMVAGLAITIADPGGPIEVVKETSAVVKVVNTAANEERDDLVGHLSRAVRAIAEQHHNPIGDWKPAGPDPKQSIVDEIGRADEIVKAKATPDEAQGYADWILQCAQNAANAAKEGGFLGFHAERVSQGEKDMLARIADALGTSAPATD